MVSSTDAVIGVIPTVIAVGLVGKMGKTFLGGGGFGRRRRRKSRGKGRKKRR